MISIVFCAKDSEGKRVISAMLPVVPTVGDKIDISWSKDVADCKTYYVKTVRWLFDHTGLLGGVNVDLGEDLKR